MSQRGKDKLKAWIGTILFHSVLILALFFMALKTPLPLPDEEGVEVNIGNSDVGQGEEQLQEAQSQPPPPKAVQQEIKEPIKEPVKSIPEEKIVEQATEEAPAIVPNPKPKKEPEKKIEKPVSKPIESKVETPPVKAKVEEPEKEPEPVIDSRLMYTGKKGGTASEGNDQQKGDKGVENGVPNAANYSGPGGLGTEGISYNLGNRKARTLPKPSYNSDDQGRVNVSIWVDKNGIVTRAEILQKGTTVSDIKLHNMAIQAALKASFAPDPEAPEIQVGIITYNFIKIN